MLLAWVRIGPRCKLGEIQQPRWQPQKPDGPVLGESGLSLLLTTVHVGLRQQENASPGAYSTGHAASQWCQTRFLWKILVGPQAVDACLDACHFPNTF